MPVASFRESRLFRAILTTAVICTMACAEDRKGSTAPPEPGSVEGRITLCTTGAAVNGAGLILVDPASMAARSALALTDADGRYRIDQVPPGRYACFLQHGRLATFDRTADYLEVASRRSTTFDVTLRETWWDGGKPWVAGVVLDAVTRAPVSGAYVADGGFSERGEDLWAHFLGIPAPGFAITDLTGRFSMASTVVRANGELLGLSPVSVTHAGYQPTTLAGSDSVGFWFQNPLPWPDGPDSILSVEILLTPRSAGLPADSLGSVQGRVVCDGTPIGGLAVAVSLVDVAHPQIHPFAKRVIPVPGGVVTTDAQGRFVVSGLVPGAYTVVAGYLPDDHYLPRSWRAISASQPGPTTVKPGSVHDVRDIRVLPTIRPLSPADGSTITSPTPRFAWTPLATASGSDTLEYLLWYGDGANDLGRVRTTATQWEVPDSSALAPGARVRWTVDVIRGEVDQWNPRPIERGVAGFDRPATFRFE